MLLSEKTFVQVVKKTLEVTDTIFDNIQLQGSCGHNFDSNWYFCNCADEQILESSVYFSDFSGTVPDGATLNVTIEIRDPNVSESLNDVPFPPAEPVSVDLGTETAIDQSVIKLKLTVNCNANVNFRCRLQLRLTHARELALEKYLRLNDRPRRTELNPILGTTDTASLIGDTREKTEPAPLEPAPRIGFGRGRRRK